MAKLSRKRATEWACEGVWRRAGDKRWIIRLNRHGKRHNFAAFSDAHLSKRLRQDLTRALERHDAGEAIDAKGMTARAIDILIELGALKPSCKWRGDLQQSLAQFEAALAARGCGDEYRQYTLAR